MKRHLAALGGATMLVIALPWLVLSPVPIALPRRASVEDRPLLPKPADAIDTVLSRAPFQLAGPDATSADESADASADSDRGDVDRDAPPQIVGIVGRLPDHAIVLVRRVGGGTRTLAVGEAIGRWRLASIAADAALFVDGTRRVRVELPAGDPPQ